MHVLNTVVLQIFIFLTMNETMNHNLLDLLEPTIQRERNVYGRFGFYRTDKNER